MLNLIEILIPIDDLLLDPTNPRFVKDLHASPKVPDEKLEDKQESTLRLFKKGRPEGDEDADVTNISDLYKSMTTIGFVSIDRVVVRPVCGSGGKYLVIEGNRRISTVKLILRDHQEGKFTPKESRELEPHLDTFQTITCMLLDTEDLSEKAIDHNVSVILGLRHHGSLLEWNALPKAYNIFTEYMLEEPHVEEFTLDNKKINAVAGRLSISTTHVKNALKAYIPYLQLRERFPDVKDRHFSLIQAAVTDRYLSGSYFAIDGPTFKLDEESLSKMDTICQFSTRDAIPAGKKKIIGDPKKIKLLGRLVDRRRRADHEATKEYADDLIHRVEDENDIDMTIDQAVDDLTAFENRKKWVDSIGTLLEKQEKDLKLADYTGTGNDRGQKDELKATLAPLRKIMDI